MRPTLNFNRPAALVLLGFSLLHCQPTAGFAQGSSLGTFTYQGRLNDAGGPVSGLFDFQFSLYSASSGPSQVDTTISSASLTVSNGLFTVELAFPSANSDFTGGDRWLEIAVRPSLVGSNYVVLSPRQKITSAPYAITAGNVISGGLAAGTYPSAVTLNNSANQVSGTFTGNGGNMTNVNAAALGGISSAGFWRTNGNTGANPTNGTFLGTADNLPVEIKVNGQRVLRLEPNLNTPNVIAGSPANAVTNGLYGAVIAGGGSAAYPNRVGGLYSSVLGGSGNTASGNNAAAMGNFTTASGYAATASGYSTTAGGFGSFAAGTSARALHDGSFVWADNTFADFASTTNNQFLIRAAGGVGINTPYSDGAALSVNGNVWVNGTITTPAGQMQNTEAGNGLQRSGNVLSLKPGASLTNSEDLIQTCFKATSEPGFFANRIGIWGVGGNSANVYPGLATGVMGEADGGWGVFGSSRNTTVGAGVFGYGWVGATGVLGSSDTGRGVMGVSSGAGSAIYGTNSSASGYAGDFYGNARITGQLTFGSVTRQMIDLWGGTYGIGVQTSTLYYRCNAGGANEGFIWYKGGVHNDAYANPGGGTELMHLVAGGLYVNGTFVSASDRNVKENFKPVDAQAVLEKVAALPLTEWNYKADADTRHVGPMAQDFYAAFGVGPDDKHIATVDADGVALAAIQGLNEKVEGRLKNEETFRRELKLQLEQKETEITELKQTVNELKQLMQTLNQNGGQR